MVQLNLNSKVIRDSCGILSEGLLIFICRSKRDKVGLRRCACSELQERIRGRNLLTKVYRDKGIRGNGTHYQAYYLVKESDLS